MSAMGKIGNYGKLWKTALDVSLRAAQEIYYLFTFIPIISSPVSSSLQI